MSKRRQKPRPKTKVRGQPAADDQHAFRRRPTSLKVRRSPSENVWELVHPRCARQRSEDLEEVQQMLDAGEVEVALDELRWLLDGCSDFVAAHRLLGELALEAGDLRLARGHLGYAYEIGRSALPPGGLPGPLPHSRPANQPFLEAAKGLAWCLRQLGRGQQALSVLRDLLKCDPSDPLGVRPWLEEWKRIAESEEGRGDSGKRIAESGEPAGEWEA